MSQNKRILAHLKKGKKITPLIALNLFGCLRLAARISDLRREGHQIDTDTTNGYAEYSLN